MAQTFAQYLINKGLPTDLHISKPMDKKATTTLLIEASKKYPGRYPSIVMHLKTLGNKFATYETQTMGLAEIAVPNKEKRNSILDKYEKLQAAAKTPVDRDKVFEQMQQEISDNDLSGGLDSATSMVVSGGMGGKKTQLMKLRGGLRRGYLQEMFKSQVLGWYPLLFQGCEYFSLGNLSCL